MCSILDVLDTYVPAIESTTTVLIEDGEYEVDATKVHQLLLFGDQLTAARIRSASVIRSTTDTGILEKFEGFTPAIVDWHARANFLDVSYKFFKFVLTMLLVHTGDLEEILFSKICC